MSQMTMQRSSQCPAGQLVGTGAPSVRAPMQQPRSAIAVHKQRYVPCAAVSVDTEASADSIPVEKSGSNFKAVMDIEAIKAVLPHRYKSHVDHIRVVHLPAWGQQRGERC